MDHSPGYIGELPMVLVYGGFYMENEDSPLLVSLSLSWDRGDWDGNGEHGDGNGEHGDG